MILLETNKGVTFERTDYVNRSKVTVRSRNNTISLMTYRFDNIKKTYTSPYISWENLNCCGGWAYDETYLHTAVHEGKKLCAGVNIKSADKIDTNDPKTNFYKNRYCLEIARKGCLKNYYDMDAILYIYGLHSVSDKYESLCHTNFMRLVKLFSTEMIELMKDHNEYGFSYSSPASIEDLIITGLLLGYPIESTISIIKEL
jgi:hypothetical protein